MHFLNHTRRLNGHVHAAIDLACAQRATGCEVTVVSAGGDFDGLLADHGVETVLISQHRRPTTITKALYALRRLLRSKRPDVVHAHMMTSAVLAWPVCKAERIPLVTTVHNEFERSSILMGLGTRVIAVSQAVARSMERRGISRNRIDVVLNGTIGSARLAGVDRKPMTLSSPSVIFVGGQHPRKGLPDLLQAFDVVHRRNRAVNLYVLGAGPFFETYRTLAASLECAPAVNFLGPQDNPFPWMAGGDIFVLPSHADPAPLVLSEAREAGCAVIATNVDGIPELLENGQAGIVVPPRDPASLSAALISLVEDPVALQDWKVKSQTKLDHLHVDRVARETRQVYEAAARHFERRRTNIM